MVENFLPLSRLHCHSLISESSDCLDFDSFRGLDFDSCDCLDFDSCDCLDFDSSACLDFDSSDYLDFDSSDCLDFDSSPGLDFEPSDCLDFDSSDCLFDGLFHWLASNLCHLVVFWLLLLVAAESPTIGLREKKERRTCSVHVSCFKN